MPLDPSDNYAGTGLDFSQFQRKTLMQKGVLLVDSIASLERVVAYCSQQLRDAKAELFNLADEIGASIVDGTELEAVISEGSGRYEWEYDLEVLMELEAYLPPETVSQALVPVPATVKVAKAELNKLAKRGGKVKEIIEAGCTRVDMPGARKVELRPRKI